MTPTIVTEFRAGLERGELLVQSCGNCGKLNMYPHYACPHCQSDDLGWQAASGNATLMSHTVLRAGAPEGFGDDLPYALAVVRLDEGVQLLTRLAPDADGEWSSYTCDAKIAFLPHDSQAAGRPIAVFGHAGSKA